MHESQAFHPDPGSTQPDRVFWEENAICRPNLVSRTISHLKCSSCCHVCGTEVLLGLTSGLLPAHFQRACGIGFLQRAGTDTGQILHGQLIMFMSPGLKVLKLGSTPTSIGATVDWIFKLPQVYLPSACSVEFVFQHNTQRSIVPQMTSHALRSLRPCLILKMPGTRRRFG